jgi:hypothetical protein
MAETLHSKLIPMAPAAKMPRGPVYSLTFPLVALLGSSGDVSMVGSVVLSKRPVLAFR